ncbi:NADH dehydrogenase [ubiquinone] 1 alpha subcomplex assembly factor 7 [Parasphingorhabdus marina DSM 22363]|uniref:NADH dehydrogenase [ubiquinone] 1 alpha subcomplex assembly factor 7 n=1 Tax=Parasphingorhabdus marina DSM 22363 TaxID=1123272 RepID=A0A1N6DEJ8_9SPHN|nr:SAM-dependent methyltransferase [Parasphingorhabdus marina]SIN69137.1 NADH dehydrogenase [ubiquinone] 1 alpha subcomplex assembly factor 7 [Parasphingorhabdus marina DSM 22363]
MPDGDTAAHILAVRIAQNGPISLGEYMAVANAHYYGSRDPLGEAGDFVTAPEISQMFGELIGIWLADSWLRAGKPDPIHYVELGPGRGTLAADARRAMARFGLQPDMHLVETSPALKTKQAELVPEAHWHEDLANLPDTGPLFVVANEFFDALPIEQHVLTEHGWRQNMVARDRNKFVAVPGKLIAESPVATSKKQFPAGTILESSPESVRVLGELSGRLATQGGAMLIIDYGHDRPGTGSTLQAVKGHMPVSPFDSPGESDLTAHVDFHVLANIARTRLLSVHGPAEQGQWLKSLGIEQRARALIDARPDQKEAVEAACHRLTHVDEMGRLFRVMAATSMNWPDPEGFVYGNEPPAG